MTAIPPVDDLDRGDAVVISTHKWSRKNKLLAAAIALVIVAGGIGGATVVASATQYANAQATADNTTSAFRADAVEHSSAAAALKIGSQRCIRTVARAELPRVRRHRVPGRCRHQLSPKRAKRPSGASHGGGQGFRDYGITVSAPREGTTDQLIAYTRKLNNQSKRLIDNTDALSTAAAKLMTEMKSTSAAVAVASTNLAPAVHTIQNATQNADQPSKDAFATAVTAVKSVTSKPAKDLVGALNSYITSAKGIQAASAAQAAADASARAAAAAQAAGAEAARRAAAVRQPGSPTCAGTPAGVKHIYVSVGQQHLWACTGDVLLTETAVTTGASAITNVHYATPIGTSHITGKSRNTVLAGRDVNGPWNDPVKFWMPFDGGIGFYDSSWQTFRLRAVIDAATRR